MHDFRCKNPEEVFYGTLRESVRHFKEEKGGHRKLNSKIEEYGDARAIEGVIDFARNMNFTDQQIEEYLERQFKLTREEAEEYLTPESV